MQGYCHQHRALYRERVTLRNTPLCQAVQRVGCMPQPSLQGQGRVKRARRPVAVPAYRPSVKWLSRKMR